MERWSVSVSKYLQFESVEVYTLQKKKKKKDAKKRKRDEWYRVWPRRKKKRKKRQRYSTVFCFTNKLVSKVLIFFPLGQSNVGTSLELQLYYMKISFR